MYNNSTEAFYAKIKEVKQMKKLLAMLLALIMALSMFSVVAFAESETEETEEDNVVVEDDNPVTGVAFAVVPMLVAGAAVVLSKKR